jgi:hypothetical protein
MTRAELRRLLAEASPGPWVDDNGYRVRRLDTAIIADLKQCEGGNGRDAALIVATGRARGPGRGTRTPICTPAP